MTKEKQKQDIERRQKLFKTLKDIEKEDGLGSIYTLDSDKANLKIERISTGLEDLDAIIGGGIPLGRVIEIFGPESAGKTTLGYFLTSLFDTALNIPIEGTFDNERAKIFGNRKGQLFVYRAKFGEEAMSRALKVSKSGIGCVLFDSVPSMIPKEDYERIIDKEDLEKEARRGGVARLLTNNIPPLERIIEQTNTVIIFINQVRDKMDAMMFGEKTQTPGGHKLKHAASLRLQVARRAWIEVPNKNPKNSAATEKVGMILKVKVVKSKVCNPLGECELPIFFDRGFVSYDDVKSIRAEIMKSNAAKYGKRYKEEDGDDE